MMQYGYLLLGAVVCVCLLNLAIVRGNSVIGSVIDEMLSGNEVRLDVFLPEFIAITAAGFALAFLGQQLAGLYSVKVSGTYRKRVVQKLYHIEYAYLKNENTATIINKINSDMAEAESFLQYPLPMLISDITAVIIYAVYIGSMNLSLLIVMLVHTVQSPTRLQASHRTRLAAFWCCAVLGLRIIFRGRCKKRQRRWWTMRKSGHVFPIRQSL